MLKRPPFLILLFILSAALATFAQVGVVVPHSGKNPGTVARTTTPKQLPCYEVAGISKAAIERRQAVARSANAQVEAVCANPALTPQQRNEEIRLIRQREHAEMNSIITPQQQEAMRECNLSRHPAGSVPVMHAGGGVRRGPCGELLGDAPPISHPQPGAGTQHPGSSPPVAAPSKKTVEDSAGPPS